MHNQRQEETQENVQRQEETQAKAQEGSSSKINDDTLVDLNFLQQWQQFNTIISNLECSKDDEVSKEGDTQEATSKPVSGETSDLLKSKEAEIIPKDPSGKIILQIEEIPPLDVFYSPKHKAVVK